MSLIEVQGVDFSYSENREPALIDVNLEIAAGEFTAIIGANGSGKSTLAKLLNVLLLPTRGNIYIDGLNTRDKEHLWDIRQRMGMVFQNPDNQLVATMVEDDVAFGLENLGVPSGDIRRRVDHALKLVDMDGYQRYSPHNLSGGQKQRVAIAGIIAMEPRCIILDEPTAMLDPLGRQEVVDTITYLNRDKGITIIYITHFMEEVTGADRVLVMDQGQVVKRGSPHRVFRDIEGLRQINLNV
ncbi:MAG: energy-coupling factor transporter ATPase, partial [Bacillota bacterium]